MAQTLRARASSLGASVFLVGGALLFALNASVPAIVIDDFFAPPPPIIVQEEPRPPAPPPPKPDNPPPAPNEPTVLEPFSTRFASLDSEPMATAQPLGGGSGPVSITNPRWARVPTNLERFYPRRALERGIQGQAVLDCDVSVTGVLSCSIVSETPEGMGFGEAARRISLEYAMVPATVDGQPAPGRYRMTVPFTLR